MWACFRALLIQPTPFILTRPVLFWLSASPPRPGVWSLISSLIFSLLFYITSEDKDRDATTEGFASALHFCQLLLLFVVNALLYDWSMMYGTRYSLKVAYIFAIIAAAMNFFCLLRRVYFAKRMYTAVSTLANASTAGGVYTNLHDREYSCGDHCDKLCDECEFCCIIAVPGFLFMLAGVAGGVCGLIEMHKEDAGKLLGVQVATYVVTAVLFLMVFINFTSFCGCYGIHHAWWYIVFAMVPGALMQGALLIIAARVHWGYDSPLFKIFIGLYSVAVMGNLLGFLTCVKVADMTTGNSGFPMNWDDSAILAAVDPDDSITMADIIRKMQTAPNPSIGNLPALIRQQSKTDPKAKAVEAELADLKTRTRDNVVKMYRDLVSVSLDDGVLSAKEEAMLLRYRREHGISEEDHVAIMRELGYDVLNVSEEKQAEAKALNAAVFRNYKQMLALAMADGVITPAEARLLEDERKRSGISEQLHDTIVEELGYNKAGYAAQRNAGLHASIDQIPTPDVWRGAEHKEGDNVASFHDLNEGSEEYKAVAAEFQKTCGPKTQTILSIKCVVDPSCAFVA